MKKQNGSHIVFKYRKHGNGTIYRTPDGKFRAQIITEGKRKSKVLLTWNDAEDWIKNTKARISEFDGPIAIESFLRYWLTIEKELIGEKTVYQYEGLMKNHIFPSIGNVRLKDLTVQNIDQFYVDIQKNWKKNHNDKTNGIRTIRIIHSILHRSMEKAIVYGYIEKNPTVGVYVPKYKPAEQKILTVTQINHLLEVAHNTTEYSLLFIALTTGMRMGELFGLQWSNINFEDACLFVKKQIKYIPGKGKKFGDTKTQAGKRVIDLCDGAIETLKIEIELQKMRKAFAGKRWVENDLVFPNSIGKPRDATRTRETFYKILDRAGIERIRFHDLRHTAASILLNSDISQIKVSKMLGHSKPSTTSDFYGHSIPDHKREVAKIMDGIVNPNIQGLSKEFSYIHCN